MNQEYFVNTPLSNFDNSMVSIDSKLNTSQKLSVHESFNMNLGDISRTSRNQFRKMPRDNMDSSFTSSEGNNRVMHEIEQI